jgi:carboxyl-terminal processing protease
MTNGKGFSRWILRILSYVLVAALASCATLFLYPQTKEQSKLNELRTLIKTCFIGEVTDTQLYDGAAAGMLTATDDQWSYYVPASEYSSHMEQVNNAYVGIGVTISSTPVETGFSVLAVEPGGGAQEAGIQAGDVISQVDGQSVLTLGLNGAKTQIRGQENTTVAITVLRDAQELTFDVMRKKIQVTVATAQMLPDKIGLVSIKNFDNRCAEETLAAIDTLMEQGAKALIFDVRFNPGGFKKELVKVLDHLLPEGPIFRSISYTGEETVDSSDADCLDIPMAVLVNASSYSAAEFFAAALSEYDKAVVVGEATTGKSYFQNTFRLSDGSAVALSVGKYCTPNGVSLAEVGGLKPDVEIPVDEQILPQIYAGTLTPAEDPQIQAAIAALQQ